MRDERLWLDRTGAGGPDAHIFTVRQWGRRLGETPMSSDLDTDPGPAVLAEAGAGLSVLEDGRDEDLSAPVEALPPQPFSLTDEVRLRPARSLGALFVGGLTLGFVLGRTLGRLRSPARV